MHKEATGCAVHRSSPAAAGRQRRGAARTDCCRQHCTHCVHQPQQACGGAALRSPMKGTRPGAASATSTGMHVQQHGATCAGFTQRGGCEASCTQHAARRGDPQLPQQQQTRDTKRERQRSPRRHPHTNTCCACWGDKHSPCSTLASPPTVTGKLAAPLVRPPTSTQPSRCNTPRQKKGSHTRLASQLASKLSCSSREDAAREWTTGVAQAWAAAAAAAAMHMYMHMHTCMPGQPCLHHVRPRPPSPAHPPHALPAARLRALVARPLARPPARSLARSLARAQSALSGAANGAATVVLRVAGGTRHGWEKDPMRHRRRSSAARLRHTPSHRNTARARLHCRERHRACASMSAQWHCCRQRLR
jgi:hypothetical protein